MKAIITVDVPEHQIGQEVSVYFKDTMCVKSVCTPLTESDDCVSREDVLKGRTYTSTEEGWEGYTIDEDYVKSLPSVQPNREKHDEEIIKETVESIWGKPPYTGINIPEDATNGDVIKALFQDDDLGIEVIEGNIRFNLGDDWWNAPYKTESEE